MEISELEHGEIYVIELWSSEGEGALIQAFTAHQEHTHPGTAGRLSGWWLYFTLAHPGRPACYIQQDGEIIDPAINMAMGHVQALRPPLPHELEQILESQAGLGLLGLYSQDEQELELESAAPEDLPPERAWEIEQAKQGFRAIGYLEALTGLKWEDYVRTMERGRDLGTEPFKSREAFDLCYLSGWIYHLTSEEEDLEEPLKLEALPAWIQEWYKTIENWQIWEGYENLASLKEDLAQAETIEDLLGPEESRHG